MNEPKDNTYGSVASLCSVAEPLTFGSLFAGIGGLDLGFERAGMQCKWQVEIDGYAQKVLAKHWPNVRRHDDVRTWPQPDTEYVDCIVGGFPCQDISYAGKGAGLQGERSGLFYEVCRIVSEMGPRFVVLENVAALLTRGLGDVLGSLASLGYDAEWDCIPAAAVGAPHIRDRLFILANANSYNRKALRADKGKARAASRARTASKQSEVLANTNSWRFQEREEFDGQSHKERKAPQRDNALRCGEFRDWEVEPAVGRVVDGIPSRVDRLRGLGNAVVPQVAEYIGRRVVAAARDVD